MDNPKFEIFVGVNDQFYYHLKARNGEIVLSGEGYTTKESCKVGIASVKKNAMNYANYSRMKVDHDQYYFTLSALNREIIGVSETYKTLQAMEAGITSVKHYAPLAQTVDRTS